MPIVCDIEALQTTVFFTVSVMVNEPSLVYVCVPGSATSAAFPSPKSQWAAVANADDRLVKTTVSEWPGCITAVKLAAGNWYTVIAGGPLSILLGRERYCFTGAAA